MTSEQQPTVPASSGSALVSLKNVNKHFGELHVLRDINLEVARGEVVCVIGPSGSGKSTILNLILRFHDPLRGSVSVDDHDLREVTQESLRQQIGAVF